MNAYFIFIGNDLKIIFRDKTLILMFFLPIILILVCRMLVPFISSFLPGLNEYYWLIIAGFGILSGATPAFLTAFLLLDEKDEDLIPVLRVTPVSYSKLITYRIVFLMQTSFVFALVFLNFNGLAYYSFLRVVATSVLISFIPAILLMLIIPFAKNKIEGVTLFKGLNAVLFIPVIAFFVTPGLKFLFGIIPFFWIYELLQTGSNNGIAVAFTLGLTINAAFFYLLTVFFKRAFIKQANN